MKTTAIAAICIALCACTTTTTTQTLPDGTKIQVVAKSSDPAALKAALDATIALAPVVERIAIEQSAKNDK